MYPERKECGKCGAQLGAHHHYCNECLVRLGLVPHSTGRPVVPGPADFLMKQAEEPILDTWVIETEMNLEETPDERRARNDRERRPGGRRQGERKRRVGVDTEWFERITNAVAGGVN